MRKIAAQDAMLRNFVKKPTMVANSLGSEEDVGAKRANLKKNSRNSFMKGGISTPFG